VDQEAVRAELPITAWEVVEIGVCRQPRRNRRATIARAMDLTGCAHLKDRLYASLSGGEKQKVSLSRCLSQQAEILILDEPTSSLDQASRRELMELIERLNEQRGITILMASHDLELLKRKNWRIHHLDRSGPAIGTPLSLQPFVFLPEETRDLSTVSALGGKGRG
jgi:zinc transport system ATP-binding protein